MYFAKKILISLHLTDDQLKMLTFNSLWLLCMGLGLAKEETNPSQIPGGDKKLLGFSFQIKLG